MAQDFLDQQNKWYAKPNIFDDNLQKQIYRWYLQFPKPSADWSKPYFTPSSAGASDLDLWLKAKKYRKDTEGQKPWQGRWTATGSQISTMLQEQLLFQDKHYEKSIGEKAKFRNEYLPNGLPRFEQAASTYRFIEHNNQNIQIMGLPDGIAVYTDDNGNKHRVLIEYKTKSTTSARTSEYSMREAEEKHFKQVVTYSALFDIDYAIIVYLNLSKKSWFMSDQEFEKNPDLRAFGYKITQEDRGEVLTKFSKVLDMVDKNKKPKFNLDEYAFSNFKTATAKSLTAEEFDEVKAFVKRALKSGIAEYKKEQYFDAFEDIKERRERVEC
ncbi:TPA_asm: hypothetical protein GYJ08_05670 [Listeria monocytogenes]|nr:hypothetical protein [Listeria monocytogenes]EAE4508696.1 hypothetical protein [Listeria monocytogenes]EAE5365898.1 hypothetical protein [Listeria monocytogenes]EAE5595127.1 hypothetical protein [Listeria monocytogenes]EKM3315218.1 hypothetical protein [Listeria monocytogenes]